MKNDEMDDFIDDSDPQREGVGFYRQLESPDRSRDPQNLNDYPKFANQTRDPRVAIKMMNLLTEHTILNLNYMLLKIERV